MQEYNIQNRGQISSIFRILKYEVPDSMGHRIEENAQKFLDIETGSVRCGKLFIITTVLTQEELLEFANSGVRDEVLHEVFVNRVFQIQGFKSYILVGRLPGVTDDEGMSAQKVLADLKGIDAQENIQQIFTQDIFFFEKELTQSTLEKIAYELLGNRLINHFEIGYDISKINYIPEVRLFTDLTTKEISLYVSDEELVSISRNMLLSLNLEEMKAIRRHFSDLNVAQEREGRGLSPSPTDCELEIIGQTWSEHCKHKEFNGRIIYRDVETGTETTINSLFKTYIKGATEIVAARLEEHGRNWLVKVFSDNAGVVRIDRERLFVFKVETHNSPSALDPYGGALTGIVGVNRDPLGTGRGGGKCLFNIDVLCFGSPYYQGELLPGQLHPRKVLLGVVKGIEDGGNKSGIPTVSGAVIFDDRYMGKPLVYCGTGLIMPSSYAGRASWEKEIRNGDAVVMIGGRVGKDGVHGATFSSTELDEHSPQSAVQIGSPITQKMFSDFLEIACKSGLVRCCTDNGAGGLSSSVGELARISGGAVVWLERVPRKYSGLKPWEIFVSESQERMTLAVGKDKLAELFSLAELYEVEATEIGEFVNTGKLEVHYEQTCVAMLDLDFLHDGVPEKTLYAEWKKPSLTIPVLPENLDYNEILMKLAGSLNICSREWIIRQYDHEVKGRTIIKPLMGMKGSAPQDASVMRLGYDSFEGIAIGCGIIPRYGDLDAYEMSAGSFDEALRQIISIGGRLPDPASPDSGFFSVNDNFCVPDSAYDPVDNPDGKYKLAQLVKMCQALYDMSTFFSIPMTSGKDSMKNDYKSHGIKISVPPTILYSMVAWIKDIRKTVTTDFKSPDDLIYLVGRTYPELGSSEFLKLFKQTGTEVPRVRKTDVKRVYEKMMKVNENSLLESSHDISDGGLACALVESAFGTELGFDADISSFDLELNDILFSESHSRFIVSIRPENRKTFEAMMRPDCTFLGTVTSNKNVKVSFKGKKIIDLPLLHLLHNWKNGLKF